MTANFLWQPPHNPLTLTPKTVQVWCGSLQITSARLALYSPLLSAVEQARARQFRIDGDRDRFILSRGMLRQILAARLGCAPAELVFAYGEFGKPYLVNSPLPQLQFNLSHSGDLALYALACDRQVGIDVEALRPLPRLAKLANRCLTETEQRYLHNVATTEQVATFLSYWTCKEAFLKAIGKGLTQAMHQLEISLGPPLQLLQAANTPAHHWQLKSLRPAQNYIAAIAVEGTDWQLSCWQHSDATG
ncbi:4'-phosphopantetheinyl transferase family protein [Almyronema epifaneia]|uniref:4'-phosphopantetheinyl transferase family protein n=1 Tax=Almyronema epifaneia S1 TaxID=2991925 RepID=A0ABW6I9X5_9CYAN